MIYPRDVLVPSSERSTLPAFVCLYGVLLASYPSSFVWLLIPFYTYQPGFLLHNVFSRPSSISSETWVCLRHNPIKLVLLDPSAIPLNNTAALTLSICGTRRHSETMPRSFQIQYFRRTSAA